MPASFPFSSASRNLRGWRKLDSRERHTLVQFLALLPIAGATLAVMGLKRAHRIAEFELPASERATTPNDLAHAQSCARLAEVAAQHGLYKATCLRQSLALCWLLRRQGLAARLRIGLRSMSKPFEAHAWVELDGVALGSQASGYQPFNA